MKKILVLSIGLSGLILSSCNKRQFTCECTIPGAPASDFTITDTQKNAQKKCAAYTTQGPPPTTCALK